MDIRKLEADDDDAPMKLPTVSQDLRIAIAQARQVCRKSELLGRVRVCQTVCVRVCHLRFGKRFICQTGCLTLWDNLV